MVIGDGAEWIQVKAYSQPFGLSSTSWGEVREQAEKTKRAAEQHAVEGRVPTVTFHFHNGFSMPVCKALQDMCVGVRGNVVQPRTREREDLLWTR